MSCGAAQGLLLEATTQPHLERQDSPVFPQEFLELKSCPSPGLSYQKQVSRPAVMGGPGRAVFAVKPPITPAIRPGHALPKRREQQSHNRELAGRALPGTSVHKGKVEKPESHIESQPRQPSQPLGSPSGQAGDVG